MIPFFRKLRRQFLDTKQLGRYLLYALGEVLLVMVGILLALQVDNWNEERKERKEELELLEALKMDLESAGEELEIVGKYNLKYLEGYLQIYSFIQENRPYDTILNQAFANLDVWEPPYLSTMTYETLKTRGIDLIRNDSLKRHIAKVYTFDLKRITDDQLPWEWSFSQNTTQRMMVENVRRDIEKWSAAPNDFEDLKENDSFLNFLSILISIRRSHVDVDREVQSAIDSLVSHIDSELRSRQKS